MGFLSVVQVSPSTWLNIRQAAPHMHIQRLVLTHLCAPPLRTVLSGSKHFFLLCRKDGTSHPQQLLPLAHTLPSRYAGHPKEQKPPNSHLSKSHTLSSCPKSHKVTFTADEGNGKIAMDIRGPPPRSWGRDFSKEFESAPSSDPANE